MSQPTDLVPEDGAGLFARARTGDQSAWQALYEACNDKVLRAIRRRLTQPAMRSLYDSSDFMGDVWKSLAEKPEKFDFATIGQLIAFLATAAERKVIDEHRRLHALRNDVGRDRPIAGGSAATDLPSGDPTPSQFAQASEAKEILFAGQTDQERLILELKGQGYSNDEIAERLGWHVRKVQRFLKDLGDDWDSRGKGRAR